MEAEPTLLSVMEITLGIDKAYGASQESKDFVNVKSSRIIKDSIENYIDKKTVNKPLFAIVIGM